MQKFPFLQVDAFTSRPLEGNPCAVIMDAETLSAEQMLSIAKEMNLAETAFVLPSKVADFGARYFTPAEEIPLAGHPTISTIFALIETGKIELKGELTVVTLELPAGVIQVEIRYVQGAIEQITMAQKKPQFLTTYAAEEIAPLFNLEAHDIVKNVPVQTVSTGTPMLMVPLCNLDALRKANMDIQAFEKYKAQSDFFSPHLFCVQGVTPQGQTFARQFGLPPDLPEDPFTGSATGSMAAFLWHYGLIEEAKFIAEQGHWMGRPGMAHVEVVGPRGNIETVKVGGQAVTILRGEMVL